MELNIIFILVFCGVVSSDVCPKQCDCDMDDDGLNRAQCVDQNIISVDVGVPKAVQVYSLSHNAISELDNFCFKVSYCFHDIVFLLYIFCYIYIDSVLISVPQNAEGVHTQHKRRSLVSASLFCQRIKKMRPIVIHVSIKCTACDVGILTLSF